MEKDKAKYQRKPIIWGSGKTALCWDMGKKLENSTIVQQNEKWRDVSTNPSSSVEALKFLLSWGQWGVVRWSTKACVILKDNEVSPIIGFLGPGGVVPKLWWEMRRCLCWALSFSGGFGVHGSPLQSEGILSSLLD